MLALADRRELAELAARREQRDRRDCRGRTARAAQAPRRGRASGAVPRGTTASTCVTGAEIVVDAAGRPHAPRTPPRTPATFSGLIDEPGGRAVPAPALEQRRARAERAVQVERRDRPARALPVAVGAGDQHDGPVEALDEPRGDDADHALVPVLAGDDVRAPRLLLLGPRLDLLRSPRARCGPRPPAARGSAPRARSRAGVPSSGSSVSSSSSAARGCPRRPAALMRGPSRKPTAPASTVAGSTPATRISACSPGFCVRASARRPAIASAAVLVEQRHDVGDRRERDEIEMPLRDLGVDAEERLAELVDDTGAAELGERIVGRPRRDDRAVGQRRRPAGDGR